MFKALTNSRVSIKLFRFQCPPFKFTILSKNRIHNLRSDCFKYDYKRRNFSNILAAKNVLPRFYTSSVDLDDNGNESDGLEELLGESHESLDSGFTQIKNYLYHNLSINDDELLVKINDCNSEDVVSILFSDLL